MSGVLLERESELKALADLVATAKSGSARIALVQGEAGLGKTALLGAVEDLATRAGMLVLKARGGELEREFAYGVARQLLERPLRDAPPKRRAQLLAGAAALAGPLFGVDDVAAPRLPGGGLSAPDAEFAAQHGLYWLVANLAARRPVLLTIDDAHWADAASLRWLVYLGRRFDGLPLGVGVAWRSGEPVAHDLLSRLGDEAPAVALTPEPLSEPAAAAVVRARLGAHTDAELCRICHERSGGNPFLLVELAAAIADEPTPELAGRLGPASVGHSVLLRLSRLPPEATAFALAVAVLDTDAELQHAAAVARLSAESAADQAAALVEARILRPGTPLRFLHPLLRAAVYAQLTPWQRSTSHRLAADVLAAHGAIERGAAHLLLVEPQGDDRVVALLRASADRALARGAADTAATQLARALAEPPADGERATVLLALGRAERLASLPGAVGHLHEGLDLVTEPQGRAFAAAALSAAMLATGNAPGALQVAAEEAERLAPLDPRAAMEMEAEAAAIAQVSGRLRAARAERLAELEQHVRPVNPAERRLLVTLAFGHLTSGDADAAAVNALLDRAPPSSVIDDEESWASLSPAIPWAVAAELSLERLDDAWGNATRLLDGGRALGSAILVLIGAAYRSRIAFLRADLATAEIEARTAMQATDAIAPTFYADFPVSQLARVLTATGSTDEALAVLEANWLASEKLRPALFAPHFVLEARIELWLAIGQSETAAADGEKLWRMGHGRGTPPILMARGLPALAAAAAGNGAPAAELAQLEVDAAQRFGLPGACGAALRALGAIGRGPRAIATLESAVELLEAGERRLELAHALVDLGAAVRRARRRADAAAPLQRGLELAARAGAAPLAERARSELVLCGLRPRRPARSGWDSLTAAERRVAEMVAEGLGNAEVAQALFVTRRTIETHLSSAYRKLNISGRGELREKIVEGSTMQ